MIARVNLAALLKEVKEKSRMKSQKKRSGYRQEYYLKNRERIARAKHEYYNTEQRENCREAP